MSEPINKANPHNEYLLRVVKRIDSETWDIYDITSYFPAGGGFLRRKYLEQTTFTLKGNLYTFFIIDPYEQGTDDEYKAICIEWFTGNTSYYRLD